MIVQESKEKDLALLVGVGQLVVHLDSASSSFASSVASADSVVASVAVVQQNIVHWIPQVVDRL